MSHTPHELTADFPEMAEKIHALKESNAHFAKLADEYHEVNRAVHRFETRAEATSEEHEHDMRHKRRVLKDQLYAILKDA